MKTRLRLLCALCIALLTAGCAAQVAVPLPDACAEGDLSASQAKARIGETATVCYRIGSITVAKGGTVLLHSGENQDGAFKTVIYVWRDYAANLGDVSNLVGKIIRVTSEIEADGSDVRMTALGRSEELQLATSKEAVASCGPLTQPLLLSHGESLRPLLAPLSQSTTLTIRDLEDVRDLLEQAQLDLRQALRHAGSDSIAGPYVVVHDQFRELLDLGTTVVKYGESTHEYEEAWRTTAFELEFLLMRLRDCN